MSATGPMKGAGRGSIFCGAHLASTFPVRPLTAAVSRRRLCAIGLASLLVPLTLACGEAQGPQSNSLRRPISAAEPLRITILGDSITEQLAQALTAALEDDGLSEVRFRAYPAISGTPQNPALLRAEAEDFDPDLIVIMVGTWEFRAMLSDFPRDSEDWEEGYATSVVDPTLDLLTEDDARVVWVGYPPTESREWSAAFAASRRSFADLNRVFAERVRLRAGSAYIDPNPVLADANGDPLERRRRSDGTSTRLRTSDGFHLCPSGAIILAQPILDTISEMARIEIRRDWKTGPWWQPAEVAFDSPDCRL